ncbi:YdcF family protein [Corynebacterium sp. 335C]
MNGRVRRGERPGAWARTAALAAPGLAFASLLAATGPVIAATPTFRPPMLPSRRPPVWGLPAAGGALAALIAAGAAVRVHPRSPRCVTTLASCGLAAAAVPGVQLLAFEGVRRTWSRRGRGPADVVLVLGCALVGGRPSALLELRLRRAAAVARRGVPGDPAAAPLVVCCGGVGEDGPPSEAAAMCARLAELGVAAVPEDRSVNTRENLANAAGIVVTHLGGDGGGDPGRAAGGGRPAVRVVTSDFHVPRALGLARRTPGGTGWRWSAEGAATPARYWATSILREFLALAVAAPAMGVRAAGRRLRGRGR